MWVLSRNSWPIRAFNCEPEWNQSSIYNLHSVELCSIRESTVRTAITPTYELEHTYTKTNNEIHSYCSRCLSIFVVIRCLDATSYAAHNECTMHAVPILRFVSPFPIFILCSPAGSVSTVYTMVFYAINNERQSTHTCTQRTLRTKHQHNVESNALYSYSMCVEHCALHWLGEQIANVSPSGIIPQCEW